MKCVYAISLSVRGALVDVGRLTLFGGERVNLYRSLTHWRVFDVFVFIARPWNRNIDLQWNQNHGCPNPDFSLSKCSEVKII